MKNILSCSTVSPATLLLLVLVSIDICISTPKCYAFAFTVNPNLKSQSQSQSLALPLPFTGKIRSRTLKQQRSSTGTGTGTSAGTGRGESALHMIFNRNQSTRLFNLDIDKESSSSSSSITSTGSISGSSSSSSSGSNVSNSNKSQLRQKEEGPGAEYIPLEVTCDPNYYSPDDYEIKANVPGYIGFDRESFLNIFIPATAPFLAFTYFPFFAKGYNTIANALSSKNWVSVDGGAYQAKIMTPAINGLVVPAMALLFATLTSTTISTLRQRQVEVRKAINMEASEMRALECLVDAFDTDNNTKAREIQDQSRDYLIQYTSRLLQECHPRMGAGDDVINPRRGMDSELNGFTTLIHKHHGTIIPQHVADECYQSIARLREQRTNRISFLQSTYPPLHYVILGVLAMAECVAFLMETDQEVLVFLNAIQIKILWSMLVGTFVACFTVFWDLRTPFAGSYQISASVGQLHTIKLTLQASKQLAASERQKDQRETLKKQQEFIQFNGGGTGPGGYTKELEPELELETVDTKQNQNQKQKQSAANKLQQKKNTNKSKNTSTILNTNTNTNNGVVRKQRNGITQPTNNTTSATVSSDFE